MTENFPIHPSPEQSPDNLQSDYLDRGSLLITKIIFATFLGLGALGIGFTVLAFSLQRWQIWTLMTIVWVAFMITGISQSRLVSNTPLKIILTQAAVSLVMILTAGMVENTSLFASPFILALSILLASAASRSFETSRIINVGIFLAVSASLVDVFALLAQVQSLEIQILLATILAITVLEFAALTFKKIISLSMRIKLVVAGVVVALIPLVIISLFQASFMTSSVTSTTNQSLQFAASQVAGKMDDFFNNNRSAIARDSTLSSLIAYLSLPPEKRLGSLEETNLRITIESLQKRTQDNLDSYGLLDSRGYNVFDTNPNAVGRFETFNKYFSIPMTTGVNYVSDVQFNPSTNEKLIFFSGPVFDSNHNVVGVLRSKFNAQELQRLATLNSGLLGSLTFPIVIDENLVRVADALEPLNIYKSIIPLPATAISDLQDQERLPLIPIDQISTNFVELGQALANAKTQPFITATLPLSNPIQVTGAIVSLKSKPWSVIYFQEQAILADLQKQQIRITILIATLVAGLISILATLMARLLTLPIMQLTENAGKITAGDLDVKVPITDEDEVGTLAGAFNLMTSRLRTLINELEDRVRARTRELEVQNKTLVYRAQQIQTVAEVARSIASAQDLEKLLTQVATLISERFGFYHVGIFLLDEAKEYAELRAANSEGGQRMLARQHKLRIGQVGIVGYVTSTGKPRIALDVGEDAVHFRNPDLPLTRSEMALPLMASRDIIGALDVQSEQTNAFSQEDIELFATLADQVAIAILNSRLYQETLNALDESQRLHRQYLRQEWTKISSESAIIGYSYKFKKMTPLFAGPVEGEDETLEPGKISSEKIIENGMQISILKVPISLRGVVIGTINLRDETGEEWDEDAIATAEAIGDQISQALENARLFEQTQRRADRERKVLEITSRIRSTTDPDAMLQIAAAELQNALNASTRFVSPVIDELNDEVDGNNNGFHSDTKLSGTGSLKQLR
jgi:GAF domain-containing protein/HAMP domain-containing protein